MSEKEKSKFYQNLVLCEDKKYCFFFVRMDKTTKIDRARNQIVIQEICTVGSMEKKRHGSNKEKKR